MAGVLIVHLLEEYDYSFFTRFLCLTYYDLGIQII